MSMQSGGGGDQPHDQLLTSLEKQLSIEMKVKNGAENMIQSITSDRHGRDKKQLLAEAQQMLADAKAKIEFLKLRILKVRQNRQLNKVFILFKMYLRHVLSFLFLTIDFR